MQLMQEPLKPLLYLEEKGMSIQKMTKADVMKMVKKREGLYRVGISLW